MARDRVQEERKEILKVEIGVGGVPNKVNTYVYGKQLFLVL